MKGKFLLSADGLRKPEANIYGDASSQTLHWLLTNGMELNKITVRLAAKESGVSLGQTQKIFAALVKKGILSVEGERTAKRFHLKKPQKLLDDWEENYKLMEKGGIRPYSSGLANSSAILKKLEQSPLKKYVVLALHSAARMQGFSHTNLPTTELYLIDPRKRQEIEKFLELEPRERGYDVLLIEPYYKKLLAKTETQNSFKVSPDILTYLDLANYPLRGREQADYLKQKSPTLKKLKNG